MKKRLGLLVWLCCIAAAVQAQNYQDVVYLKNGGIIRGVIVEQQPNVLLKVKTGDGNLFVFQMAEVEKMTKVEMSRRYRNSVASLNDSPYPYSKKIDADMRGYCGFVEVGTIVNFRASGVDIARGGFSVSTSHGYRFNPHLFLGGGLALDYHSAGARLFIPVFVDFRTDFLDRNISPVFDVKVGYSLGSTTSERVNPGVYFNPSFGGRFMFNQRVSLAVMLGYNMQQQGYEGEEEYHYGGQYHHTIYKIFLLRHGLSLRIGVGF